MQVRKADIDDRRGFFVFCFFSLGSIPRLVMIDGQDNQLVTER